MDLISYRQTVLIDASPEKVWGAITEPALVGTYHFTPLQILEPHEGGKIAYGEDKPVISGSILEWRPNFRLSHGFQFQDYPGTENDPESVVTYLLEPDGESTSLTLVHSGFQEENQTFANISQGWPHILEGLKNAAER